MLHEFDLKLRISKGLCLLLIFFGFGGLAQTSAIKSFEAGFNVRDAGLDHNRLYLCGSGGLVKAYSFPGLKVLWEVQLPAIKNFLGQEQAPVVSSLSVLPGSDAPLVVSQGSGGFQRIYRIAAGKVELLVESTASFGIIQYVWQADESRLIMVSLASEVFVYNLNSKKTEDKVQFSQSPCSSAEYLPDKQLLSLSDEAGKVYLIHTDKLSLETTFSNHLDKIYQCSFGPNLIATGGRDRKIVVQDLYGHVQFVKELDFMVFSVALSDDGQFLVFSSDEANDLSLNNLRTKAPPVLLKGHNHLIVRMFFSGSDLISIDDSGKINFWKIK